jgi:hypothetical protein
LILGSLLFIFPENRARWAEKRPCPLESLILSWFYIDIPGKISYYRFFKLKGRMRKAQGKRFEVRGSSREDLGSPSQAPELRLTTDD